LANLFLLNDKKGPTGKSFKNGEKEEIMVNKADTKILKLTKR
jgi:hypothetical protein